MENSLNRNTDKQKLNKLYSYPDRQSTPVLIPPVWLSSHLWKFPGTILF